MNSACNAWFTNPPKLAPGSVKPQAGGGSFNRANAVTVYKKFLKQGESEWEEEAIEAFFSELKIDPYEDMIVYLVAYHQKAERMGALTEAEFVKGCEAMGGADSIDKIAKYIPQLRNQINDKATFKAMYKHCYGYACDWQN